ncbi:MAG: hypothetical protein WCQ26_12660, partial [Pseudanabaena sp. ELA748]
MLLKDKPELPHSENTAQISGQISENKSTTKILLPKLDLPTSQTKSKIPFWKLPAQVWNNVGVRWKLSIVLLLASGLPVLIVTQILVKSSAIA